MMGRVTLRGIDKCHPNGVQALRNVHLDIAPRKLTTLLGPSGCGKSTLLRLIAGLDTPSAGRIEISGRDHTHTSPELRPISMVFQSYALFPHLSVLDNVRYGPRMQNLRRERATDLAMGALDAVGLRRHATARTDMLSGGEQQRVALARALALRPEVLLLDEPLSNVDAGLRRQIREEIRALHKELGLTVIYVTHDQNEAMAVSDVVVVMHEGRVMQAGSPSQVYESPSDEFVANFMGDAVMFDAWADPEGRVRLGPLTIEQGAPRRHGRLRLVVRPHAWAVHPASGDGLAGRVLSRAYLGRAVEYEILTELGALLVLARHESLPRQVGAPVSLFLGRHGVSTVLPVNAAPSQQQTQEIFHG